MRLGCIGLSVALLSTACGPARRSCPLGLLSLPSVDGTLATTARLTTGGETRAALLASAAWDVPPVDRALLTMSAGVSFAGDDEPPGWYRVIVRLNDRTVLSRRLNPRALRGFRDFSIELGRIGRRTRLSIGIGLEDRHGRKIAQPRTLLLGVAEPTLHDLNDYGLRPGIILVSIDTLRRDHVGYHGYPRPTTPLLARTALTSIVCDDNVSPSSWTLPAHIALLTSVDPATHGGVDMRHGFNKRVPTLPGVLRQAGFATQAVTSHLYVSAVYGLDEGFDRLDFKQDRRATDVVGRAIALLDRFGDRPFFIMLHFYDPHWHYDPPPSTRHIFERPYHGKFTGFWNDFKNHGRGNTTEADLNHLIDLYDGEIRYVDDELARLDRHLGDRGLRRSTLLVVTSDHGEEFLDHGGWEHQRTLYEEVIRVPLLFHGPRVTPRRETSQTSLLDVAPTILEWSGVAAPATMLGRSLLKRAAAREAYGETEHTVDKTHKLFLRESRSGLKLILSLDRSTHAIRSEEWFDLAEDPKEQARWKPRAEIANEMRERALARFSRERTASSRRGPTICLSQEQRDRLRVLGYVEPGDSTVCPE